MQSTSFMKLSAVIYFLFLHLVLIVSTLRTRTYNHLQKLSTMYQGARYIYLQCNTKVTLHFSFLNKSSFVSNCNKASIGVVHQHVSKHNACKTFDKT